MEASKVVRWLSMSCIACSLWPSLGSAQSYAPQRRVQPQGAAQERLRPLGSPSAVDEYRPSAAPIQQVAMMQSFSDAQPVPSPSLPPSSFNFPAPLSSGTNPLPSGSPPPSGFSFPPSSALPVPLQSAPVGPIMAPPPSGPPAPLQGLPLNPNLGSTNVGPSSSFPLGTATIPVPQTGFTPRPSGGPSVPLGSSDYAAIPSPQLGNAFATIDNCRNISAPSSYRAAGAFGCGTPVSYGAPVYGPPVYGAPTTYLPPPAQIAPAVAFPSSATLAPVGISGTLPPVLPGSPGYRPLISFGQESNPVQVGQGVLGQPVAYVPGQRIRNLLRYMSF